MKKIFLVTLVLMVFGITVALIGCKSNNPTPQNQPVGQNPSSKPAGTQTFTLADLKNYTGQNGSKAYVAVNGVVYDVTNARKWRNGKHENGIVAGTDLTDAIGSSPHGTTVLGTVPKVGTLK